MASSSEPLRLELTERELVVVVRGWRRLLAMQRGVRIPLATITEVVHEPFPRARVPVGLRRPRQRQATGLFRYGSYPGPKGWSFWAVGTGKGALVIRCATGRYRFVVLQVEDPVAAVARVRAAVEAARAARGTEQPRGVEHRGPRPPTRTSTPRPAGPTPC